MKKLLSVFLLVFALCSLQAYGQVVAWDPSGLSNYGPSPWSPTTSHSALTIGGLTRFGANTSPTAAGNAWGGKAWVNTSCYAQFTIRPNSGYKVSLSTFRIAYRRSSTGSANGYLQYSLNGTTFTNITTLSYSSTSSSGASHPDVNLSGVSALQNVPCNTTITFRVVNYNGASTGTWYIYNSGLSILGSVAAYPVPSVGTDPSTVSIAAADNTTFDVSGVSGNDSYQWQRNTSGVSGGSWVNITSAGLDPTGTYSGFASTSTSSSNTLTLNNVPASWNGYGYRCAVTNCSGTTYSNPALLNVSSGACSGIPTAGTAVASTDEFCESGSTTLNLTSGSTGTGLTYQWSSSNVNAAPGTDIPGATNLSYTTPTLTDTTYYWCTTTCTASTSSSVSAVGMIAIKPLPVVAAVGGNVCSGGTGLAITATGADTYSWAPSVGLSASTGDVVMANPTANTVYTITGTTNGCSASNTVNVTFQETPTAVTFLPTTVAACMGDAPMMLAANGGTVSTTHTINSGSISVSSSISSPGIASLMISSLPADATITGVSVTFNGVQMSGGWNRNDVFNLKAPNGNILNLYNTKGAFGDASGFVNTTISSSASTSLPASGGTYTGTYRADASSGVGPSGNVSNVTSWSGLYGVPNGTWQLIGSFNYTSGYTEITSWSLEIDYTYQAPLTWSPTTNLFTDASGTTPYTGTAAAAVYYDPTAVATEVYTATATNGSCSSNGNVTVTVNPLPASITGTASVCVGATTTLANSVSGGTWSSSSSNATVDGTTGVVTGVTAGTAVLSYTLSTGCFTTINVTINPLPAVITGTFTVCEGATETLGNTDAGGTWSSSNATNASVGSATGVVTGNVAGTATITYTLPTTCYITAEVTVNQSPSSISGTAQVCEAGSVTTLTATPAAGTWSAANANATVGSSSGIVTGATAGTVDITYTLANACYSVANVTVNALPTAISGSSEVCVASNITLASTPAGGSWASSAANATIDATTGVVSGVSAGTATISYTSIAGCVITKEITINALPAAITGTAEVCVGATTTLNTITAGGSWSSTTSTVGTIDAISGVVDGLADGTVNISYTLGTGCAVGTVVTVHPLPASIGGVADVCVGSTTTLSNTTTGGTWFSFNAAVATVNVTSGLVSGVSDATVTISYTLPTGCTSATEVTVNPLPASITGTASVCPALTTNLFNATAGGTWYSMNAATATIDAATGTVTGVAAGTVIVTYGLPTGCNIDAVVTVNPLPMAITGTLEACVASTTTLANATATGTWSSSDAAIASVGGTTGVANGVAAGTATISYSLSTGCYSTAVITVNPLPTAFPASFRVCNGSTYSLSSSAGGVWTSDNTTVAGVTATTGLVSGLAVGTAGITYTLSTGCIATGMVSVDAAPAAISGSAQLCLGITSVLGNSVSGGTWSSSNISVASIDASGNVTGNALGSTNIYYTLTATGCYKVKVVTVNALPVAHTVTGGGSYCAGGAGVNVGLDMTNSGTQYALSYGGSYIDTVSGTGAGIDFGLQSAVGVYSVLATNTASGCQLLMTGSASVVANPLLTPIVSVATTAADTTCSGVSVDFTPVPVNGGTAPTYEWSVNGTVVGTGVTYGFVPANGDVVSVEMTSNASCRMVDTAVASRTLAVLPTMLPTVAFSAISDDTVCETNSATLTTVSTFSGDMPAYAWFVNGVLSGSGTSFTYTPADNDMVMCRMISSYLCRTEDIVSTSVEMTVLPMMVPSVTIIATPGLTIAPGQSDTLTAEVANGGVNPIFEWDVNGTVVPGATTAVFVSNTFNNFDAVTCKVVSDGFCGGLSAFNTVFINVVPSNGVVNSTVLSNVTLIPNPNNGVFTVTGLPAIAANEALSLTVTDMLGQVVFTTAVQGNATQQNIILNNTLANGMYLLSIRTATQNKVIHFNVTK